MASRSSTPTASEGRAPRRRPADRREVILRVAAKAFSDSGYHAVRLDDIAEAAGISAPALYRHFPNKYALFAETARSLADALATATAAVPVTPDDPAGELRALLAALTAAAVANRRTGGIYHWEADYLEDDDAQYVRAIVVAQHRRMRGALLGCRRDLDHTSADLITAAMTSVVASPATHRTVMSARQIVDLITDAATRLSDVELPPGSSPPTESTGGLSPTSKREVLLAESIRLFAARGFHDVTIDDIARAADLPPSGVYRHFESKAAILQATFWRASDRVTTLIADALSRAGTPREAIVALVNAYIDMCCTDNDILAVYSREIGNIEARQRTELRSQQRINVEEWAAWLTRDRPELSPAQARFLVQAALNVIMDLTRSHRDPSPDRISTLGLRILLGETVTTNSDRVHAGE
ncbi:TetR/AcrR family transcriptional regulator [Gordonia sp. PKS22-38]|uniref:TetR/AcrR family transcriptional regulator n=1 Tax=Gordonia prachuapensis TaxID=3115651 RepID=A0ABU7MSJ0_9ACTN|nr:TetR/AcrR family transcriptional regulator [Gordonia sp. PKS22-38]